MTVLPVVTDYVSIQRHVYNAMTKQSQLTTVYTNVPVFIREVTVKLGEEVGLPDWDAEITCDAATDILDGDQILGWNPLGKAIAPIAVVNKVNKHEAPFMPQFPGIRIAYLKILEG